MRILQLVRILWEDFRAWRRGMTRVAPRFVEGCAVRGRVYAPKARRKRVSTLLAVHRDAEGRVRGVYFDNSAGGE